MIEIFILSKKIVLFYYLFFSIFRQAPHLPLHLERCPKTTKTIVKLWFKLLFVENKKTNTCLVTDQLQIHQNEFFCESTLTRDNSFYSRHLFKHSVLMLPQMFTSQTVAQLNQGRYWRKGKISVNTWCLIVYKAIHYP